MNGAKDKWYESILFALLCASIYLGIVSFIIGITYVFNDGGINNALLGITSGISIIYFSIYFIRNLLKRKKK